MMTKVDISTQKHLENSTRKELMFVRFDRHIPGRMCLDQQKVLDAEPFERNKNLEYGRS